MSDYNAFNQTILELKFRNPAGTTTATLSFNQTILELKYQSSML